MFVLEYVANKGEMFMKKKLLMVVTFVFIMLFSMVNVFAAPASTIKINSSKNQSGYVAGATWAKKVLSDGTYAYCLDHHKDTPYNQTLVYKGDMDAGFSYIILNGYPYKSFTGKGEYDYYITQGAVHWYQDRINGVSDSKNGQLTAKFKTNGSDPHKLRPYMKTLVENALKARSQGYVNPTASMSVSSKTLKLDSSGKYFMSNAITLSTKTGMTSKIDSISVKVVSGPSGTVLVDKNGKTKTSFKSGDTFYVRVPASSLTSLKANVQIRMDSTGSVMKVSRYERESNVHGNVQDLTAAKPYTYPAKTTGTIDFTLTTTKTTISKQDITTKKELPGATLVLKNANGKVVDQWVSGTSPHVINHLPEGKYTLTETIAPDGYIRAESITFEVKNGQATTVTMKDDYTKIKISKIDITTEEELPGAHLVIKDANGKVVAEWVSTDKAHYIEKLKPGKYTLEETIAPDGYIRAEKIEFEVSETGDVQTVTMVDDYTKVEISKQDVTTKKELAGAQLRLLDEDGKTVKQWISTDEPLYLEKLKVGKYKLVEEVAPEGYVLAREALEFEVLETGDEQKVVLFNTPLTPTPDTAFHVSTLLYVGATLLGSVGIFMIYKNSKKRLG